MEKTTVYLTAAQKAALARAAAAEGRSEARLIRTGIDVVTARHRVSEGAAVIEPGDAADDGGATPVGRPRWLPRDEFVRGIVRHPADAGLRDELRELAPDLTDETSLR